jgi:hypothetical protein
MTEYSPRELRAGVGLDGPCLLHDGTFALFVSLRGKDGGTMPSPSELRWSRDLPDRMRVEPVHVFFRRGDEGALYLGTASFVRAGSPRREGFEISFRLSEPLPEPVWRGLVSAANAPPPPSPEEAIVALTGRSTAEDRVRAMEIFVERWYAPITAEASKASNPLERTPLELPEPLRRLYGLAAKRDLFGQNRLVKAEDLAVEDGKLGFYIENQGVCVWAVDHPAGHDPPVFVRGNAWGDPWVEEAPTLSGFVIQMVIFEAVLCAGHFSARHDGLTASELRKLQRKVAPLVLPPWSSSKTQFVGKGGIVGFVFPDADLFQVELAARDRASFEAIEDLISEWPDLGF